MFEFWRRLLYVFSPQHKRGTAVVTAAETWIGPAWQFEGGPRDGEEVPDGCYRDGQIYDARPEGHYRIQTRSGRVAADWVENPREP